MLSCIRFLSLARSFVRLLSLSLTVFFVGKYMYTCECVCAANETEPWIRLEKKERESTVNYCIWQKPKGTFSVCRILEFYGKRKLSALTPKCPSPLPTPTFAIAIATISKLFWIRLYNVDHIGGGDGGDVSGNGGGDGGTSAKIRCNNNTILTALVENTGERERKKNETPFGGWFHSILVFVTEKL